MLKDLIDNHIIQKRGFVGLWLLGTYFLLGADLKLLFLEQPSAMAIRIASRLGSKIQLGRSLV